MQNEDLLQTTEGAKRIMAALSKTIITKEPFTVPGDIGLIQIVFGDKKYGLRHIIRRRFEERSLKSNNKASLKTSIEETTAVLIKAVDNIMTTSSTLLKAGNTWEFRKDGIVSIVRRDKNNKDHYLLTGFADNRDKIKEATVTIAAVNAKYRYTPEFADLYAQVGAVIASDFRVTIPKLHVNC